MLHCWIISLPDRNLCCCKYAVSLKSPPVLCLRRRKRMSCPNHPLCFWSSLPAQVIPFPRGGCAVSAAGPSAGGPRCQSLSAQMCCYCLQAPKNNPLAPLAPSLISPLLICLLPQAFPYIPPLLMCCYSVNASIAVTLICYTPC